MFSKIKIINALFFFLFKKNKPLESTISSLAPKILTKEEDLEKVKPYLDKLKETIDARGISNIALTGSYGSGKSTIIKTFRELNPKNHYLNISLAAFNVKDEKSPFPLSENKDLERLLEISILQQIFYHVKASKIPESRFKRITNFPWWKFLIISICFVIWILSIIILLKYNYLDKINPKNWNATFNLDWIAIAILSIALLGLGKLSKLAIQLFNNSKINKVNIKGELELGDKITNSVFNEHLEEIFYFFERTKYNVLIIEDLDRFDNTDIFTKLREINILLNNSKLINREINFVYAVGDDLFKNKKERVKFFEYIIPIIPFINSSNADVQLQTLIEESGLDKDIFPKEFVSDVITFIDDIDMRLLINIFHEFVIYRLTLKPDLIKKPEELFSIITYKNLEPGDFAELNKREGKLYKLIHDKKVYIENFVTKLNQDIKDKQIHLDEIENETINDYEELRAIYISHILSQLPEGTTSNRSLKELLEEDKFEDLKKGVISCTSFVLYSHSQYLKSNSNEKFSFSEIEKIVNPYKSYNERFQLIKDKSTNKTETLKKEIQDLKILKADIESWDLKQIFQEIDLDQYINEFSNNALLRNLILNGYINENYNDYISLFHEGEGAITRSDLTFERNVKGAYISSFDYELSKIEGLIERIDLRYFKRESILNFDLLDFLGDNYGEYTNHYDSIIQLLSNERETSIEFIDKYIIDEDRPIKIFLEKLIKQWENFFNYIVNNSNYPHEKINSYLRLIFSNVEVKTVINHQNKTTLYNFIAKSPEFLSLFKDKEDALYRNKLKNIIRDLGIKFETLEAPTEDIKELFERVYEDNHYIINKENVLQMLQFENKTFDDKEYKIKNYTSIKESDCQPVISYVDSEIDEYIKSVYLLIEENTEEDEAYLIELLNNEDISESNKNAILEKTSTIIKNISEIEDVELRLFIFNNCKLQTNWENIYKIYLDQEMISEEIINFLNIEDNASLLSKLNVPSIKDEDGKMIYFQLWKDILSSPDLSLESFKLILNSSNINIRRFDFENTLEDRLEIMILEKKFKFDNDVYNKFDSESGLNQKYLESYKDELLSLGDFQVEEEHLSIVLKSKLYSTEDINNIFKEHDITECSSIKFLISLKFRLTDEIITNIKTDKIVEAILCSSMDIYDIRILNNYFFKFNKLELKTIINSLKNIEYRKYLSNNYQESLILSHNSDNEKLFELMKAHNFVGERSKKTKKGYQIFKNKTTNWFR